MHRSFGSKKEVWMSDNPVCMLTWKQICCYTADGNEAKSLSSKREKILSLSKQTHIVCHLERPSGKDERHLGVVTEYCS